MVEWIPCSEKLPPNPKDFLKQKSYLVTVGNVVMITMWADGWNCALKMSGEIVRDYELTDVTAWAELPEPYQEGEKNE